MQPPLEFTSMDLQQANADWGCNCGPAALAAVWRLPLREVRKVVGRFDSTGYMNALDMQAALMRLRLRVAVELADGGTEQDIYPTHGLCLVQWGGPWITGDKPNLKWALTHTHWIATKWDDVDGQRWIFDVNATGWLTMEAWTADILPLLLAADKHRDGTHWLRHSWEIRRDPGNRSRRH